MGSSRASTARDAATSTLAPPPPFESPLARPGILCEMVSPETHETARGVGADPAAAHAPSRRERTCACVAVATVGCGVGAFFAALAGMHEHALAVGVRAPSQTWMAGWTLWLPIALLGFAAGRLLAIEPRLREGLRWLAFTTVLVVAAAQVAFRDVLPWLCAPPAAVLGIAAGTCVGHVRRLPGVLAASLAGVGALLAACVAGVDQALVAALGCGLVGVLLCADEHAVAAPTRLRWRQLVTIAVAAVALVTTARAPFGQPFVLAALTSLCLFARLARRDGLAFGASLAALGLAWLYVPPLDLDEGGERLLARAAAADVVYRRADQELQLRRDGDVLFAVGPDRFEQPLALALSRALLRVGDRVLVCGGGGGVVAPALREGDHVVDVAPASRDVSAVAFAVAGDGPVLPPDVGAPAESPSARPLARRRAGSQQLVVIAEVPSPAGRHRATRTFQRELRRVVGDGYVAQPIALDRVPAELLQELFDAAAAAHRWNGLYRVGDRSAVLLSGRSQPDWHERLRGAAAGVRWALHRAHLGDADDVDEALLGALRRPAPGIDLAGEPASASDVLLAWLQRPEVTLRPFGQSVLRRWARRQGELQRLGQRLRTYADDEAGRAAVQAMALPFLPSGAPAAWLQAALGLEGRDGVSLREPSVASRCAHAIDPTFFTWAPPVFATLPPTLHERGELELLATLPPPERLAELCVGDEPYAVALRVRFASRCAQALLAQLDDGPLTAEAGLALRELADPFVLREAARVLVPAGRWRELLGLWRGDLPMPPALLQVTDVTADERLELAAALRGRRDASCHPLLAELLVDDDLRLRRVAAELLRDALGTLVPYDPEWPRSERLDAAERLRGLHNRKP